jgi:hypothetical protein
MKTAQTVETTPYIKLLSIKINANTLPSILFGQYFEQYEKIFRLRMTLAILFIIPCYMDSKIKSETPNYIFHLSANMQFIISDNIYQ